MDYLDSIIDAPSYSAPSEIVRYTESQSRFLPVRITRGDDDQYALLLTTQNSNVIYLLNHTQADKIEQVDSAHIGTIDVNDCVDKCQKVLGLKINEIAKLSGVSRASLDLHRKGANVKDMTAYHRLYTFVSKVELLYDISLKHHVRNVLIERKTLVQHLLKSSENLDATLPLIATLADKVQGIAVTGTEFEQSKLMMRTHHIGKMA